MAGSSLLIHFLPKASRQKPQPCPVIVTFCYGNGLRGAQPRHWIPWGWSGLSQVTTGGGDIDGASWESFPFAGWSGPTSSPGAPNGLDAQRLCQNPPRRAAGQSTPAHPLGSAARKQSRSRLWFCRKDGRKAWRGEAEGEGLSWQPVTETPRRPERSADSRRQAGTGGAWMRLLRAAQGVAVSRLLSCVPVTASLVLTEGGGLCTAAPRLAKERIRRSFYPRHARKNRSSRRRSRKWQPEASPSELPTS